MSDPDRIWAWEIRDNLGSSRGWNESCGVGRGEYIHADAVAEMIRQAVADAEAKALRRAADELKGQGYNTAVRQILALLAKPIMSGDDTGR